MEKLMTVPRKDGAKETTKLERIGTRAKAEPNTVFNNLAHILDLNLLRESYHRLDGNKAIGIDKVTKEIYGSDLENNLQDLLSRIYKSAYKPQPSKLIEIPKEDGSTRPLAISCFEDKIVQQAVSSILTAVYEPIFLPCSYGYREGINAHMALRDLMKYSNQNYNGAVVEIDLRKYFNTIPHGILLDILGDKISDKRFIKIIETLIRSPIMANGKAELNKIGCPQGSIISPILANIYLHYVIDEWFYTINKTHITGRSELVRFADDMVFVFENYADAKRFYEALPKRLEKFGLKMHEGKSSLIISGRKAAALANINGKRLPIYKFLGFIVYWGLSRAGFWRLKFKSRADRFTAKLNELRKHLHERLNQETQAVITGVIRVVKGWINYYAISDNQRSVHSFIWQTRRALFNWRNRKGGQRKLNWKSFANLLKVAKYPETFKTTSMFRSVPNWRKP